MTLSPSKTIRTGILRLEGIPNIGKSIADDLRQLGIKSPSDLPGRDPYEMYEHLCQITDQHHDPSGHVHRRRAVHGGRAKKTVVEVHG